MSNNIIAVSHHMKSALDDDYTLYEDGTVLHQYDLHHYPGGYNLEETLTISDLSSNVKERLINSATENKKELVEKILHFAK